MKKLLFTSALLLCIAVLPAAAQELTSVAAQPAVIADARTSPDGCAIRLLPDGGFMVFATGSGTYDFTDEGDVANARKAAEAAAKANLAKFMKESLSTASSMEESSKMVKSLSSNDDETEKTVDKEMARKTLQAIKSSADALLKGVVTLSEAKVPGTGTGGEIRVVCGVSSKTLEAHRRLTDELNPSPAPVPVDNPPETVPVQVGAPSSRSNAPDIDLLSMPDGVAVRMLPAGGFMILSAASAAYDIADADDIQQARRNAESYAKAGLARFMQEQLATDSALEESTKMVKKMTTKDDSTSVAVDKDTARKTLQTIKTSAKAVLKGVAAFADATIPKGNGGEVRVLVGVTSETLEVLNNLNPVPPVSEPSDTPATPVTPAPPVPPARQPTVRSTLPSVDILSVPDGVAVLIPPEGGFYVLSAATAGYDFGDPDDTLQAKRNAEMKAKAELARFMKEKLATESSVDESTSLVKSMGEKNGEETSSIDKNTARQTLQKIKTSAEALLQGVATFADANIPGQGKGGEMRVLVGVSDKTLMVLDQIAPRPPVQQTPVQQTPVQQTPVQQTPPAGQGQSVQQPAAPQTPAVEDDWIQCVGTGNSRPDSIRAALVEGVSMVFGTQISQDVRLQSRFKTFREGDSSTSTGETKAESEAVSATSGFVRQYRVVEVKNLPDGIFEATVRALLVNPRSNTAKAVFVSPTGIKLADKTKNFQMGPKARFTGAELARKLNDELATALAAANRFVVLTPGSLVATGASFDLAKSMVDGGLAPESTLLNACDAMTADYILGSAFENALWSSKIGLDKATGRMGPQRKLTVRVRVKLTDVRTASAVASDTLSVGLDEEEIAMILDEDEDADLLFYALKKIAPTVEEWIASVK